MKLFRFIVIFAAASIFLGISQGAKAAAGCYFLSADIGYVCDANPPAPKFSEPRPVAESILPRLSWGRIADHVPVYAEPSSTSPVVRDSGDGYLFYTIRDIANNDIEGRLYYMIGDGEWVQGDHFSLADPSDFHGFEIRSQPTRPFGWMVVDFQYSPAPGAEPEADAIKLPRYTPVEVYAAKLDSEGWIWYDIGYGRWMKQTYVSIIDITPRPEEIGPDEYWVEIDLFEQSFTAYEGNRMVYAGLVSSGLNKWPTYEGLFQVWERHEKTDMAGAEGRVDWYVVEDVPHTMFFDFDIALHGAYWHDRFGYKHSHGCVNMPPRDAEWIFNWSAEAPNDLWVYVHTSDPHTYFDRDDTEVEFGGP